MNLTLSLEFGTHTEFHKSIHTKKFPNNLLLRVILVISRQDFAERCRP